MCTYLLGFAAHRIKCNFIPEFLLKLTQSVIWITSAYIIWNQQYTPYNSWYFRERFKVIEKCVWEGLVGGALCSERFSQPNKKWMNHFSIGPCSSLSNLNYYSRFGQISVQGLHILIPFSSTSILELGQARTHELESTTKLSDKKKR